MSLDLAGLEMTRVASGVSHRREGPRLNRVAAVVLVVFLFVLPIPLGANRPVFWAINAVAVGGAGALYGIAITARRQSFRVPLGAVAGIAVLWLAFCAFAAFQMLLPIKTDFAGPNGSVTAPVRSLAPGASLFGLVQFATLGVFFFLVLQVGANRGRAQTIAWALFAVIVAHAIYGLLALTQFGDTVLIFEKWAYPGLATGTFVNRNAYATFLAFGLVLGTGLAGQAIGRARQPLTASVIMSLSGLAVLVAALYLTQSRMGVAAGLAGSLIVLCGFAIKMGRTHPRMPLWTVLLALALVGLGAVLFGSGWAERLGSVERDFDVRAALYAQVGEMIVARPFLGFGGGSFEVAFPLFHRLPVSPDLVWDKAHSTYLALWAEYGVIAGSIPLFVAGTIALRCAVLFHARQSDWLLSLVALGVTATAGLHSLVDFSLEIQANALFFAALLALGWRNSGQGGRSR